jgi:hypothetical protein
MHSILELINPDISYLIDKHVKTNIDKKKLIQQLNDKIMFTKHMNYYKKFKSFNENYLQFMISNEDDFMKIFKKLENKYGWIPQIPVIFSPWVLSDDPALSKMTKRTMERGDSPTLSYIIQDTRDDRNIELFFYPPSKRFYNYNDLIKYVKS